MLQSKPIHFQNQLDSLHNTQHYLQMKVDSLNKIVNETRIGTGFFSDVISQDLYMFTTIVFFAGLITWGSIYTALAVHKRQLRNEMSKSIDTIKNEFDKEITSITDTLDNAVHDVNRAMYGKVLLDSDWPNAFGWAVSCVDSFAKINPEDTTGISAWLQMSEEALDKVSIGNKNLADNIKSFTETFNKQIYSENEEIRSLSIKILKKLNHIVYTIPPVPEDLFETATPAEDIEHEVLTPTESNSETKD